MDPFPIEADFALSLFGNLPTAETAVLSPLSIILSIVLVHSGARGPSRSQITSALLPGKNDADFDVFTDALSRLIPQVTQHVSIANGLFIEDSYTFRKSYVEEAQRKYGALFSQFSGKHRPEAIAKMNKLVNEVTHGRIVNLLDDESIQHDTIAFLINALHFQGKWDEPFYGTFNGQFYWHENEAIEKQFMRRTESFAYMENEDFQMVSLPYVSNRQASDYSFIILLPRQRNGLHSLTSKLNGTALHKFISTMRKRKVDVTIPKFKAESTINLVSALKNQGIQSIFNEKEADLTGMFNSANVSIDDGVHKVQLEIDEKGTVGAAATAMRFRNFMAELSLPVSFVADHPFLFLVKYQDHIIFIGKLYK